MVHWPQWGGSVAGGGGPPEVELEGSTGPGTLARGGPQPRWVGWLWKNLQGGLGGAQSPLWVPADPPPAPLPGLRKLNPSQEAGSLPAPSEWLLVLTKKPSPELRTFHRVLEPL